MILHHLPSQPTPFIGRQAELAEIADLLVAPACRLLTLVGPGGIGKTRLSLEVARQQQDVFPDGVYFVSLQPLIASDFIVPAIAEALHFQFYPDGEPHQQLLDYLREKSLLLVLDNFEHLLDGVGWVSDLLASAQAVKILATSRERLNLLEEWVLEVQGLTVPASEAAGEIKSYSAIQLFLQSAQRAHVGFTLTEAQKPAVTLICHLVGGMPLGIELAAAWVRALSCEEIAAEIERGLDILATPARNVPPRHRNMRAVLEHSWNLLTEEERDVFQKLAVFRGGFRKEAAKAVAGATLRTLSVLVDKSLLRVDANGRYDLHELLRQYAQEKLESNTGTYEQTLDLHAAFYAAFMARRDDDLRGSEVAAARREIEGEIDNIRKAWEYAITPPRLMEIEQYLWGLFLFYEVQGWLFEGEEAFTKAIQAVERIPRDPEKNRILGQLYARQAYFAIRLGYYERGKALTLTSVGILRPLETRQELAFSLIMLGAVCIYCGDYAEAEPALQAAIIVEREDNRPFELAWALHNQARLLRIHGQYDRTKQVMQECITLCRERGLMEMLAESMTEWGLLMEKLANYEEARGAYEEAIAICQVGLPFSPIVAYSAIALGRIAYTLGEEAKAAFYYQEAFQMTKRIGSFRLKVGVLLGMTELQLAQEDKRHSMERLALIVHHPASLEYRDPARVLLDKLELELPPDIFAACQEKGKELKLDEALESVFETHHLRVADSNVHDTPAKHRPDASGFGETHALTERELEILHLMAQGMSNREIAAQLILSIGTVKWYGSQICGKLHAQNRVQAIARARELKILV